MEWVIIDKQYFDYLYSFDTRIGHIDYGDNLKLHLGVLLQVNEHKFYVPISSPKSKHLKMKNSLDFHKLHHNNHLIAVLNLNNMIPVQDAYITYLHYSNLTEYRHFKSLKELNDYVYLLQIEKTIVDELEPLLKQKAIKLYNKCLQYPQSNLSKRCCNFKLLEQKSLSYIPKATR